MISVTSTARLHSFFLITSDGPKKLARNLTDYMGLSLLLEIQACLLVTGVPATFRLTQYRAGENNSRSQNGYELSKHKISFILYSLQWLVIDVETTRVSWGSYDKLSTCAFCSSHLSNKSPSNSRHQPTLHLSTDTPNYREHILDPSFIFSGPRHS